MAYLLDSNAWIGYLRQNRPTIISRLQSHSSDEILLCSVVLAELHFGAERSGPTRRVENFALIAEIRADHESLPFDDTAAEVYGRLRAGLAVVGTPVGPNDLMIASIALSNDLTLVTHNTREFSRIPGLKLEDWQA
jgi:tRNA(fMet)-specific endonuclease VapC